MADYGRVAHDQGQAVVVGPAKARVAHDQGQAVVTPLPEFRVATMFVEVFVTLREVKPPTPPLQQGGARSGFRKKNY